MPDFGLTEALAKALEASKAVRVMRPAEQRLAAAAAKTAPAAPTVPSAPPVEATPTVLKPSGAQVSAGNPTDPGPQVFKTSDGQLSAPEGVIPGPPTIGPAPTEVTAGTGDATPPTADLGASQPVPEAVQPPPQGIASANTISAAPAPEPVPLTDVQQAAARFVHANMSEFKGKLDLTHMPNVNVIDSPDQWKAALLQVADDNKATIEAARGPTASNEQLTGLAQDLAINADTLRQHFDAEFGAETPENGVQRRALITAARMVEQNEVGTALALSDKVANGTATSEEILQWKQHTQAILNWRTRLEATGAESGRDLQALGIHIQGTLPPEVLDHIASVLKQNNPDMQATAAAIKLAGTPQGIASILDGRSLLTRIGSAGRSLWQRVFINGILSGPQTWMHIFTGNNFNLALNNFDILAAGVGRGIYGLAAHAGEFPTAVEGAAISDAVAHMHGVISGGADALRVAGRVLKTGQSMDSIMRLSPGEIGGVKNYDARLGPTQSTLPELRGTYFGSIARTVDTIIDAPGSRVIAGIDDFTKTLGYRGYVTMMSLKEIRARLTAGTLRPGDAEQVMRDMMNNPSEEMQQAAEDWAHRMTFQTPFPSGGKGEAFTKFLNKAPSLRFIIPFMRTATNIFKQSVVERTPFALLSARIQNQIAAGGFEADLAKSRIATGVAASSMVAWMAIHDRITGSAPKDPRERAAWELDGRTPNSIRVTNPITGKDEWHDYSWFEPMAGVASITADAVKLQSYLYRDDDLLTSHEQKMNDAIGHIVASVIQNTGNKTFMMGAAQFSEMYNDPQHGFEMWKNQMGSAMVPYSGLTRFLRNEQDPFLRHAQTLMDKIRDDLPTAFGVKGSKSLPVSLDVFGEPRMHRGGNAILGPLNPLPGSPSKKDDVSDEVQSLMAQTHEVPLTMPTKIIAMEGRAPGVQGGQGMRLTPAEYNDYVRFARSEPIFNGGTTTFREKLSETIASPVYQGASPAFRVELLKSIQHQADEIGRNMLYKDNADFRERMTAWTAEANRIKRNQ